MSSSEWPTAVSPRSTFGECSSASGCREDVLEGRWVIETRHRGKAWEIIVEPDFERQLLVVVTAYPVWE